MDKDNASASPGKPGFTLVELLVVVGIIAILVGILLPTLSRVRAAGNATACMSNLRQVGQALVMYANDNRDKYPGRWTTGRSAYRRRPGLKAPEDPSSYPEWLGLAAVLHGIKITDYSMNQSVAQVQTLLNQQLAAKPRYLPGASNVWVCPAFPPKFIDYGNTYAFSIAAAYDEWTSVNRGRGKNLNAIVVWDNSNLLPWTTGRTADPTKSTNFALKYALYPHPSKLGGNRGRNNLYFDGRVESVGFKPLEVPMDKIAE